MPKVVDHEQKRIEIALNAAEVFLQYGYKNTGMRQLCQHLHMSKSAVYHYFDSKDAIFRAATEAMLALDSDILKSRPLAANASLTQRTENFLLLFHHIAPRFFQEQKLVVEYIEVIGVGNIATDPCMKQVNQKYLDLLTTYVDEDQGQALFTLFLGLLNHQLLMSSELDVSYIEQQLQRILASRR
ncbi:TetR/AcrR family transcriptional regulator [Motilimonas sp. KMU-193]|uniref:TetR/AcrR family transcriptional regulator n=1 Tax=Motilimonas sp. KMU-193 TaxID=3388668 RepID=UPI00396AF2D9